MSAAEFRPRRNLAAWGYESDSTGTRVEVDVWTVNRTEAPDDLPDPDDLPGSVGEVLARAGNVVKVDYLGAAGVGYQYLDLSKTNPGIESVYDATSQAFAGSARAAGGSRTAGGTFGAGAEPAVVGPSHNDVIDRGENHVLPAVRRELQELGRNVPRDESSDEIEEPVETQPFDGYRNVVRIFPRGGSAWRYRVTRGGRLVSASSREEPGR